MANWYCSSLGNENHSGSSESLIENGVSATTASQILTDLDTGIDFSGVTDNQDYVRIISGTDVTPGLYKITGHTINTLTLATDPGNSATGDIVYYIGGAVTLAKMVTHINLGNAGFFVDGDIYWIKADGTYTAANVDINVAGDGYLAKSIRGYINTIGDSGKALIARSGGSGAFVSTSGYSRWILRNLIIDGNTIAGINLEVGTYSLLVNIESKDAYSTAISGSATSIAFNCYANGSYMGHGFYVIACMNCVSANVGYSGFYKNKYVIGCIAKNSGLYNATYSGIHFQREQTCKNSIIDGGNGHGILLEETSNSVVDTIILNITKSGKKGIYFNNNALSFVTNVDFYNVTDKSNNLDLVEVYYELDPQFTDPDNLDYTRIGNNLDDKGFSEIGMVSGADYNIDIGIDQQSEGDYSFASL